MNLGGKVALAVKLPGTTTRENPPSQTENSTGRAIVSSRHLDCVCVCERAEVALRSDA